MYTLQVTCINCGGSDVVAYNWTLESLTDPSYMAGIDIDSYATMDDDGSLTVDTQGFIHVITDESFALVFRGRLPQNRW